jgi:hypothetical protein
MNDHKPKGRGPKHTLEALLLKTVEGRKATPEERARALAAAFHSYCFKNELDGAQISADAYCSRGIIHLGSFDPLREVLPPTLVEDEKGEA